MALIVRDTKSHRPIPRTNPFCDICSIDRLQPDLNHPRSASARRRIVRRHVGRFADRAVGRVTSHLYRRKRKPKSAVENTNFLIWRGTWRGRDWPSRVYPTNRRVHAKKLLNALPAFGDSFRGAATRAPAASPG